MESVTQRTMNLQKKKIFTHPLGALWAAASNSVDKLSGSCSTVWPKFNTALKDCDSLQAQQNLNLEAKMVMVIGWWCCVLLKVW